MKMSDDYGNRLETKLGTFDLISDQALISIAISLKRIADKLELANKQPVSTNNDNTRKTS